MVGSHHASLTGLPHRYLMAASLVRKHLNTIMEDISHFVFLTSLLLLDIVALGLYTLLFTLVSSSQAHHFTRRLPLILRYGPGNHQGPPGTKFGFHPFPMPECLRKVEFAAHCRATLRREI